MKRKLFKYLLIYLKFKKKSIIINPKIKTLELHQIEINEYYYNLMIMKVSRKTLFIITISYGLIL
jgi:hypothetical protein